MSRVRQVVKRAFLEAEIRSLRARVEEAEKRTNEFDDEAERLGVAKEEYRALWETASRQRDLAVGALREALPRIQEASVWADAEGFQVVAADLHSLHEGLFSTLAQIETSGPSEHVASSGETGLTHPPDAAPKDSDRRGATCPECDGSGFQFGEHPEEKHPCPRCGGSGSIKGEGGGDA